MEDEGGPAIEHIVLYSVREHKALESMVRFIKSLAQSATRDGTPYIRVVRLMFGAGDFTVPRHPGFNLASVITFASDQDQLYFVKEDPAHQSLIASMDGKLAKEIMVLDFVDGAGDNRVQSEDC